MGETRTGGATRTIPKEHRGAGAPIPSPAAADELVFGNPPARRRGFSPHRQQVEQTVVPAGLIPAAGQESERPSLKPGDPVDLYPTIVTFEEYKPQGYREAGMLETAGKYELVKIHRFGGKPLFEFKPLNPSGPIVRSVFIKAIGHGRGWVTATKTR